MPFVRWSHPTDALQSHVAELKAFKAYIYVQTPGEQALRAELRQISQASPESSLSAAHAGTETPSYFAAFLLTIQPMSDSIWMLLTALIRC